MSMNASSDRWSWRGAVRPISGIEERRQVEALRYRVYVGEMAKPYPHADHEERRLADPLDDVSLILGAFDARTVVGTVRCTWATAPRFSESYGSSLHLDLWADVPRESLAVCSRLVVEPEYRGKHRTSVSLMCAIYFFGREQGISVCLCSTTPSLLRLFERFGFRQYAAPFLDNDAARVQVPLVLLLEDLRHLNAVSSPFLAEALRRNNRSPREDWQRLVGRPADVIAQTNSASLLEVFRDVDNGSNHRA